jgi:hypothetical protein
MNVRVRRTLNTRGARFHLSGPCIVFSVTAVSLGWQLANPWGLAMDVVAASEMVAGLLASGVVKQLAENAGGGLTAGIAARVQKVFGSDGRAVDALERARGGGSPQAVADLASALAWYARRDQVFAEELAGCAAQAGTAGVTQNVRADRDAYAAGHNQTVVNYWRSDE